MGRDKARAAEKNKGSKASGSSSMNDDAMDRLMVTEMIAHDKEQRDAFIKIKRREVECREQEVAAQEYRTRQEDISNSVLIAIKLFELVISEKLALVRALKSYLMRGSSRNASTLNNSRARVAIAPGTD
ncbi:hypothetical protein Tco_1295010 [Tanacetum coccineum]